MKPTLYFISFFNSSISLIHDSLKFTTGNCLNPFSLKTSALSILESKSISEKSISNILDEYQIKYVQNYKCGKDIQKSELDKILFKKFSDLKILNEINETFPLDLDTDMVNSIYRVTLRARNIIRYRNSEVSDVWDDFNYFASQLDYSFSEIS